MPIKERLKLLPVGENEAMLCSEETHGYLHEVIVGGVALVSDSTAPAGRAALWVAGRQVEVSWFAGVAVVTLSVILQ